MGKFLWRTLCINTRTGGGGGAKNAHPSGFSRIAEKLAAIFAIWKNGGAAIWKKRRHFSVPAHNWIRHLV